MVQILKNKNKFNNYRLGAMLNNYRLGAMRFSLASSSEPVDCTLTATFYKKLLETEGLILEEAVNKRPIATQNDRLPLLS
jgi:hypothetical protein